MWPCVAAPTTAAAAPASTSRNVPNISLNSTIYFAKTALRGQAATLERLRVDRQLQEALAHGPDPLLLAAMFGLDPKTAIRYAEDARQLLQTAAEERPVRFPRTQGSEQPIEPERPWIHPPKDLQFG